MHDLIYAQIDLVQKVHLELSWSLSTKEKKKKDSLGPYWLVFSISIDTVQQNVHLQTIFFFFFQFLECGMCYFENLMKPE